MNRQAHEEFEKEVIEKTKPLSVPEESEECMKEDYEFDINKRGPRSRPEYERRKNHSPISSEEEQCCSGCRSDTDTLSSGGTQMKEFKVRIGFEAIYTANSEDEVKKMISDEFGLGDVANLDIDIDEINKDVPCEGGVQ